MMDVFLKLLGVFRENAGKVTDIRASYQSAVPLWLVLFIAALLIALTFWLYKRTATYVTPGRRYVLASLRAAFLCSLLVLVLHPVLTVTVAGAVRQSLLVVIDTSASMGIEEERVEQADINRAAIATGAIAPEEGLESKYNPGKDPRTPRIDLVKAALRNEKLNLVSRLEENYDIYPYTFDRTLHEVAVVQPPVKQVSTAGQAGASFAVVIGLLAIITGAGLATFLKPRTVGLIITGAGIAVFIGSLLTLSYLDRKYIAEHTGAKVARDRTEWLEQVPAAKGPVTAIGSSLLDVIARKRGQGAAGVLLITDGASNVGINPVDAVKSEEMPIWAWGVGVTSPRDIAIPDMGVESIVFVRDEAPVTVRVEARGLAGESAKVVLKLGDRVVDTKEISLDKESQPVNMKFTPERVGEDFVLTASVEPREGEANKSNNLVTKRIRVVDTKIKVLQIEQSPRWEFKYLQAMLMRDRRVDYKCVLLEADPVVASQEPYLRNIPSKKEELAGYDLIMLGDVDPKRLSPAFMESLSHVVSKLGVSFTLVAGRRFSPNGYRGSPIELMLPVEFDSPIFEGSSSSISSGASDRPIMLELTDKGKESDMIRLTEKSEENVKKWASLPPIYWTARVARAKENADVLLVDPDPAKRSRFGKMPVFATHQYGRGRVLYVGTDNTWRWRKNLNEQDFVRLWGQMVESMALTHLRGASKRTVLTTNSQTYATGDYVGITARLYKENFDPITDPTVIAYYAPRDNSEPPQQVILNANPDAPGFYAGEFVAGKPGHYQWWVEKDSAARLAYTVTDQTSELIHTAMNEKGLVELCAATKGKFFREEDLKSMPDIIKQGGSERLTKFEVEFAFSPLYFLLMLTLVTVEWIIRKLSALK